MDDQNNNTTVAVNEETSEQNKEYQKKIAEYLNQLKRLQADFINYRRDEAKRLEEIIKFANESVILEMLDIVDDMEMALKHEEENKGTAQIFKKMNDLVEKYGVQRIDTSGSFDPLFHEALGGEGDKLEEIRAGYMMHGKVIRPARVLLISLDN